MKDLETKLLESAIPPEYKHGRLPLLPSQIQVNIFYFTSSPRMRDQKSQFPSPKCTRKKKIQLKRV